MQSVRYFCPILTKFEVSQHIFVTVRSIKLYESKSGESALIHENRRTQRRDEAYRRFSIFIRRSLKRLFISAGFVGSSCHIDSFRVGSKQFSVYIHTLQQYLLLQLKLRIPSFIK